MPPPKIALSIPSSSYIVLKVIVKPCLTGYQLSSQPQDLLDEQWSERINTLTILRDMQKGQERTKEVPKEKQNTVNKTSSQDNIQNVPSKHCTSSPKLRHLLLILAEAVMLHNGEVFAVGRPPSSSRVAREDNSLRFLTPPDRQLICGCNLSSWWY